MNDHTIDRERADEAILAGLISDEGLEAAAAGARAGGHSLHLFTLQAPHACCHGPTG